MQGMKDEIIPFDGPRVGTFLVQHKEGGKIFLKGPWPVHGELK